MGGNELAGMVHQVFDKDGEHNRINGLMATAE